MASSASRLEVNKMYAWSEQKACRRWNKGGDVQQKTETESWKSKLNCKPRRLHSTVAHVGIGHVNIKLWFIPQNTFLAALDWTKLNEKGEQVSVLSSHNSET